MNVDKCAGVERVKNNNVKPTDKPDISCFVFLVIFPMDLLEKGLAAKNFAMLGLGDIVIPGLSILKTLLPAGVFFFKNKILANWHFSPYGYIFGVARTPYSSFYYIKL